MSDRFKGKVAVITGGNSGIGLATAKAFAREGAKVAITGRSEATLKEAQKVLGPEALVIKADMSRLPEITSTFERIRKHFDKIDALFVNAGIAKFVPFLEVTEEGFDETMATNVKGLFFTVQKAAPLLSQGAAVVLNASVNAHKGFHSTSVYGASKAAVLHLAKSLSLELQPRAIRVNVVSPGPITTPIFDRLQLPAADAAAFRENATSKTLVKRFGDPEEIASAVLFLSSPEASFVLGSELVVDGGLLQT